MKLPGFIGGSYLSPNPQFDCSRAVNLYPVMNEYQEGTNKQITQLLSTPGLTDAFDGNDPSDIATLGASSTCRMSWTASTGQPFFICGDKLFTLTGAYPFTPVLVGQLNTSSGRLSNQCAADNGQTMFVVDGPYGYSIQLQDLEAGVTVITSDAFYGATDVQFYDSIFLFNQPGTSMFYWTDPGTTNFDPLNFAFKSGDPDPIVGLVVLFRQLFLIGSQTTEFWYDTGGTAQFTRQQGPYAQQGCGAPLTIAKSEAGVFWLAQNQRGGVTVVMTLYNGTQPNKISTIAVDFQLQQYQLSINLATAFVYQQNGSLFYWINPPNGTSSWVYDATTSATLGVPTWHERTYTVPPWESTNVNPNGFEQRHLADSACFAYGTTFVGAYDRPMLYILDPNNPLDDGAQITRTRQAPHFSDDANRVFYGLFRLLCQTGQGAFVANTFSTTNTYTNALTLSANVTGGGCTYYGYYATGTGFPGAPVGTLTPNTYNSFYTKDIAAFVEQETNLGSNALNFIVYLNTNSEGANAFNWVEYFDGFGNRQTYNANQATFVANVDGKWDTFTWGANTTYNSMRANGFGNPILTTAFVNYNNTAITTINEPLTPNVALSWSDDGGYVWSDEQFEGLGAVGRYGTTVQWWRLGEGTNRVFRVRCFDPVILNLMDAVITVTPTQA